MDRKNKDFILAILIPLLSLIIAPYFNFIFMLGPNGATNVLIAILMGFVIYYGRRL